MAVNPMSMAPMAVTPPERVPRLRWRPTRQADLPECMPLVPPWLGLSSAERAALPALWAQIVNAPAIYSMVIEDLGLAPGQRVQAWGVAMALAPEWVARWSLDHRPEPLIVARVYRALLAGETLMDETSFGRVNACGELSMLCLHYGMHYADIEHPYVQALIAAGNESMRFGMSGHQLSALYYENAAESDGWMRAAGFLQRSMPEAAPLHYWGMSRAEAMRTIPGSTARQLFESHPPRFRLSVSQRRLLWRALFDEDDARLAQDLGVSAHGLKKLWRGIYERVSDVVPDFFGDAGGEDDGKRGPEKRRQVLAYVRQRPEELRPWVGAAA